LANGQSNPNDIQVTDSADGGQTWAVPVRVAAGSGSPTGAEVNNDKEYIAAWGHGNAIITWTQFTFNSNHVFVESPIFASVTHDGGNTWTAPVQISGNLTADQASVPVVAADGSIDVAFETQESFGDNGHREYAVVKVDPVTGQPLQKPVKVADVIDAREDYPINAADNETTYQDSQFRTRSFGNMTADPTNALHLAVVWSDMRNSTLPAPTDPYQTKTNSDIVMSQSFDGGNTWSTPTALAIPNDQFMPWGAYNASGQLQIGYFDRSYDPANHKYGYTLASETTPGSLNFTFQQVTTTLSDPTQGDAFFKTTVNANFPNACRFIGDYANIAVTPNGVAALWTDMRLSSTFPGFPGSSENAFFALVDPPAPPAPVVSQPAPAVAFLSRAGSFASVSFVEASVFSARLSSTLPAPAQNSDIVHPTATSVWSLDSTSEDRHLTNFSQSHISLTLTRAAMHSVGLLDKAWQGAFGIDDFATEELQ
jgi:hypothetical protein